jgi:hypothetical protein
LALYRININLFIFFWSLFFGFGIEHLIKTVFALFGKKKTLVYTVLFTDIAPMRTTVFIHNVGHLTCLFCLFLFDLISRYIFIRVRFCKAPIRNEHDIADFDFLLFRTLTQRTANLTNALPAVITQTAHPAISEHCDGTGVILIGITTEEFRHFLIRTGSGFLSLLKGFTTTEIP